MFGLLCTAVTIYLGVTVAAAAPVLVLLRHRARWSGGDLTFLFLPIVLWAACCLAGFHRYDKGLGNITFEWLPITAAIVLAIWLRGLAGDRPWRRAASRLLLMVLSLTTVACCYFTPTLGG